MEVNVFGVVRCPWTDDRITLPHPTICTKHKLFIIEKAVERMKNKLEDLP